MIILYWTILATCAVSRLDIITTYGPNELDGRVYESARRLYCIRRRTARREHAGAKSGGGAREPKRGRRNGSGGEPCAVRAVSGRRRGHSGDADPARSMKRIDLIRHLERHGCELLREGSNHTMFVNLQARRSSAVPR